MRLSRCSSPQGHVDRRGWVLGTSGNFSSVVTCQPLRIAITPSAAFKGELRSDQILEIEERSAPVGAGRPLADNLHIVQTTAGLEKRAFKGMSPPHRRLVYSPLMKVLRREGSEPVSIDPKSFTSRVRSTQVASDVGGISVHVYRVEFDEGARTHWHRHTGSRWLLIIGGRIRVQKRGAAPQDVGAGDTVVTDPGEKHRYGAAPGSAGTHLTANLNSTTKWLEDVSDDQYSPVAR